MLIEQFRKPKYLKTEYSLLRIIICLKINIILDSLNLWWNIYIFLKKKKSLRINSKKELNKYKSMSDSIQFNNIFKTRRDSGHILGA